MRTNTNRVLKEDVENDVLKVNLNFRQNSKESLLLRTNRVLEKNLETDVLKVMLNFRHNSKESLLMRTNRVSRNWRVKSYVKFPT